MSVVLREREASQISRLWKYSQIIFHFITFFGSIFACIPFEKVRSNFHGNCMLNAQLSLTFQDSRIKVNEDPTVTKWGSTNTCSFCAYSLVASAIYAFVFGWFYAMCPRGGRPSRWGYTSQTAKDECETLVQRGKEVIQLATVEYSPRKPWLLVVPSLIFGCSFAIILAVVSGVIVSGGDEFCKGLTAQTNLSCHSLQNVTWENYDNMKKFYNNLVLAESGCWIAVAGWCAIFSVGLLRCCFTIDFVAQPPSASTVERNVTPPVSGAHDEKLDTIPEETIITTKDASEDIKAPLAIEL